MIRELLKSFQNNSLMKNLVMTLKYAYYGYEESKKTTNLVKLELKPDILMLESVNIIGKKAKLLCFDGI